MRERAKGFTRELKVGLFIFIGIAVVAAFAFKITDQPLFRQGTKFVTYLDDATGIFKNSKVKLSGIDIGVINKIELENGKAKITLIIDKGITVPPNASVVPRPLGILGDKYIDIVLPGRESGQKLVPDALGGGEPSKSSPGAGIDVWRFLGVGGAWAQASPTKTPSGAGQKTDSKGTKVLSAVQSPATIDDMTRQLGKVAEDLKAVSGALRNMVEGEGNVNSPIGRTLRNAETLSRNLNDLVGENRKDVRSIVKSTSELVKKIDATIASFDQKKMSQDLKSLSEAAGNMSRTVQNLELITHKITSGEGTLGRLVTDDSIAVEFERTLRTVNQALDRAQRTLTVVELRSEYLERSSDYKTYIGLAIYPREDSGYLGFVVIDPNGTIRTKVTTEKVGNAEPVVTETVVNDKNKLKFSVQYYRRFWELGFRLGLFESTGGLATDFYLLKDRVRLAVEFFDFSRTGERANLKTTLDVSFLSYFHIVAGGNELLASSHSTTSVRKSYFAGLGLRFTDDDLKTLLLLPRVN